MSDYLDMENLVVSIDLQKKLLEQGLFVPSLFCWNTRKKIGRARNKYSDLPAHTAHELISILPVGIRIKIDGMRKSYDGTLQIKYKPVLLDKMDEARWSLNYDRFQSDFNVEGKTLPDVIALMILKLISKNMLIYPTNPLWAQKKLAAKGSIIQERKS